MTSSKYNFYLLKLYCSLSGLKIWCILYGLPKRAFAYCNSRFCFLKVAKPAHEHNLQISRAPSANLLQSNMTVSYLQTLLTSNTDGRGKKLVTAFAEPHHDRFVMKKIIKTQYSFVNGNPTPTSRHALRGKCRAITSLHRDNFAAKVSGLCPVLASVNAFSLYRRPLAAIINIPFI